MKPTVLITGASGFLGRYVFKEFVNTGYNVHTLGRSPVEGVRHHIKADIGIDTIKLPYVNYYHVIHVAGKAHVYPKTEAEKQEFISINLTGTLNLLDAFKNRNKPEFFTFISSVAVYGLTAGEKIKETYSTQPYTVYGDTKLKAEKAVKEWCEKNNIKYLILRLPLVAGANAPGNLGSMKNAIIAGKYPKIIGNTAAKSIVLATEVAQLITNYQGEASGIYNLTDGQHPTFEQIEKALEKRTSKKIKLRIPLWILKLLAKVGDGIEKVLNRPFPISTDKLKKLTCSLTFDDSKAVRELNWEHKPVLPFLEEEI